MTFSPSGYIQGRLHGPEFHRCVHDIAIFLGAICQTIYLACSVLRSFAFYSRILMNINTSSFVCSQKCHSFFLVAPNHLPYIYKISNKYLPTSFLRTAGLSGNHTYNIMKKMYIKKSKRWWT